VARQKSALSVLPAGQEPSDAAGKPSCLSLLNVELMLSGETPNTPKAL
jgi:hypothetical protein